jgi:heterodisulfide reductase subunit B
MEYAYYPGCSLQATARSYDESLRTVFSMLDLRLHEIPDWNCCGATMYMSVDQVLASCISARTLALAERLGHDIVAPCSSCFTILNKTRRLLTQNPDLARCVGEALEPSGLRTTGCVRVRHPLEVLINDVGIESIAGAARRDLAPTRVAHYYGCQIVRQEEPFDDRQHPTTMDRLFEALGAHNVPFSMKVRCCGGMLMTTTPEVGERLAAEILECARSGGADCIVTTCPLCQINLEAYQKRVAPKARPVPVLFFTQLLGLALGAEPKELGLHRQLVPFALAEAHATLHS